MNLFIESSTLCLIILPLALAQIEEEVTPSLFAANVQLGAENSASLQTVYFVSFIS